MLSVPTLGQLGAFLRRNPWATPEDIAKHFDIPLGIAQWCLV